MATWLDQQIEQLENIVERHFDSCEAMCTVNSCILPRSHENKEPHISLVEFLEMRYDTVQESSQIRRAGLRGN